MMHKILDNFYVTLKIMQVQNKIYLSILFCREFNSLSKRIIFIIHKCWKWQKNSSKVSDIKNRVYSFVDLHPTWSKSAIVKHFMFENIPRSTIYIILQKKANKIGLDRKVGSGRPAIKFNQTSIKRLKTKIDHSHGISQRLLATMFGCHQSYVCRTIKRKTSIRYRKKGSAPGRTPQQKFAVRPKCSKLATIFRKKKVVIDDESFFFEQLQYFW